MQAVPNETTPHYTLNKQGVVQSKGAGVDILYRTTACLRINQTSCLPEFHDYREVGSAILNLLSIFV